MDQRITISPLTNALIYDSNYIQLRLVKFSISMFLWCYCHPSTAFQGPKVQALVQDRGEGLQSSAS